MGDHYGRREIEADRLKEPSAPAVAPVSLIQDALNKADEAAVQEFINDLKGMSKAAMERELEIVTRRIEEDEPWQEALTAAIRKAWWQHAPYEDGDPDAPDSIKDRNGEIVLSLCRRCGKGEIELFEPCVEVK